MSERFGKNFKDWPQSFDILNPTKSNNDAYYMAILNQTYDKSIWQEFFPAYVPDDDSNRLLLMPVPIYLLEYYDPVSGQKLGEPGKYQVNPCLLICGQGANQNNIKPANDF